MKFKITAVSVALLLANSVLAQNLPYYSIEKISVNADGALYGPFPTAISEDATVIITHSMKASLSSNVDIGLPFTFNRECQYDNILCELEFYGSQTAGDFSYENAYKAWRNAQSNADINGYSRHMMANVLSDCPVVEVPFSTTVASLDCSDNAQAPFDLGDTNTDVKVTGFYQGDSGDFIIGYSSDAYVSNSRGFVRRAFIKTVTGTSSIQLLPDFIDDGGFSSAYKIQKVGTKVLVVGHVGVSYAGTGGSNGNSDLFDECYNSDADDERSTLNELTHCPGFDTQAWYWDVTNIVNNASSVVGTSSALANQWLEGVTSPFDNSTFSAHAADINNSGIAVGASSFEYNNNTEGARERAIIMTPATDGSYSAPQELTTAVSDIDDEEDNIYNTWAVTISDVGLITGNREYNATKGRNKPTEFFVYDNSSTNITFPFKDLKVATTEQYLENGSYFVSKNGANSRVYDANKDGFMVGELDDYDQVSPVYEGSPRSQTAFLYDYNQNQAWLINDLICSQDSTSGEINSPLIRIITARIINEAGVVLADGYVYPTADDYTNKSNGVQTVFRLTPNDAVSSPNDSPNCWQSDLISDENDENDETYERSGAATLWLWLFALPLIFIRRLKR